MRAVEYRWLVIEHSLEIYGGIVAAVFASLGIWLGLKLTRERVVVREVPVPAPAEFVRDEARVQSLGITARELEVLRPDRGRPRHARDRRPAARLREHGEDAFQPGVRQARRQPADPGGSKGARAAVDSVNARHPNR